MTKTATNHVTPTATNKVIVYGLSGSGPVLVVEGAVFVGQGLTSTLKLPLNTFPKVSLKELWTDAEASFKKALDIEPEYPHAWMGLAVVLLRQERFEEAHEADEKAKLFEWNIER